MNGYLKGWLLFTFSTQGIAVCCILWDLMYEYIKLL